MFPFLIRFKVKRKTKADEENALKQAVEQYSPANVPKKRKSIYKREKPDDAEVKQEPEEKPETPSRPKRTRRETNSALTPDVPPTKVKTEAKKEPEPIASTPRSTRRSLRGKNVPVSDPVTPKAQKVPVKVMKSLSEVPKVPDSKTVDIPENQNAEKENPKPIETQEMEAETKPAIQIDPITEDACAMEIESSEPEISEKERERLRVEQEEKEIELRAQEIERIRNELAARKEKIRLELEEEKRQKAEKERIQREKVEKERTDKENFERKYNSLSARDKTIIESLKVGWRKLYSLLLIGL